MPEENETTNSSKIIWFILSTVTLLVISLVGAWAATKNQVDIQLQTDVFELKQRLSIIDMKLDMLLEERGLRYQLPPQYPPPKGK